MIRSNAVAHSTAAEEAGQRLKRARERLNLRFRDVEEASGKIAARRGNDEFLVALSRLADIENKGTVPSVFRLYSLCAIYRLDVSEVLSWYGVDLGELPADSAVLQHQKTHLVGFHPEDGDVTVPLALDPGIDVSRTVFLSRLIQRWGTLPLMLLNNIDLKNKRYGLIGTEDWSMYPVVPPGSLVVIDDSKRRIVTSGWKNEYERPIYFLEHRDGYACGWCSLRESQLIVQPHPASNCDPEAYIYPDEIEVIGQVTEIALSLGFAERRRLNSE
ncbi:MAG: helix-turn-helix transcriptional regulator [Bryobacteraceae bacterium]